MIISIDIHRTMTFFIILLCWRTFSCDCLWWNSLLTGYLPTATMLFEGLMVGVVKVGLVVPSPEANKALWIESGSMLFFFFLFLLSLLFFVSFLMSHGSKIQTVVSIWKLIWYQHWIELRINYTIVFCRAAYCWTGFILYLMNFATLTVTEQKWINAELTQVK